MGADNIIFRVLPVTDAPANGKPPAVEWDNLVGQEHAKRALEVALAGSHSILFVGSPAGQTQEFALWGRQQGLTDCRAATPCPCGWYGDSRVECTCTLAQVTQHQQRYINGADIQIEMPRLETHKITDWVAGQRGEPENGITGRVLGAASYTDTTLDDASQSLLRAAVRQLSMSPATVRRTLAVARTIANLEAAERIETYHLAEAIQYRPRRR